MTLTVRKALRKSPAERSRRQPRRRLRVPAARRGRPAAGVHQPETRGTCDKVPLSRVARDGVEPSEAGVIPALSRNGDAPECYRPGDEPGRLARADVLSSAEGRFVRSPVGVSRRALPPPGSRR